MCITFGLDQYAKARITVSPANRIIAELIPSSPEASGRHWDFMGCFLSSVMSRVSLMI